MKDKILVLMEKELTEKISFLSRERIAELIQKLEDSNLSNEEKREVADHILANYVGETDDNHAEDLIDWLLKDAAW